MMPPSQQEARGLDAGDRLAKRLVGMGDNRTAAIVWRIAAEERAHVAVGACACLQASSGSSLLQIALHCWGKRQRAEGI